MPDEGKSSCLFVIATDNCDEQYKTAITAGAISIMAPVDQFWGARSAVVLDPYGYRWSLPQKIEEVSPKDLQTRINKLMK